VRSYGQARRKFGRERDHRRSLIKNLADSLISHESIVTTLPKAREIVSYTERLITKAKVGDLHSRRQVISGLATKQAASKLVDELVPLLGARSSGYFKVEASGWRRGDQAAMAKVSFVDDLSKKTPVKPVAAPAKAKPKALKSTTKKVSPAQTLPRKVSAGKAKKPVTKSKKS